MTAPPRADGSGAMFDGIAPRYDLLNSLISFGMDRRWRRRLVEELGIEGTDPVLDVASGTADIAIAIAQRFERAAVVGLDPSPGMLAVGAHKLSALGLTERVRLVEGDAQKLPFDDDAFAASCIAFGIRNVPDRHAGLREMARVTRRGGRVVVLELGEPRRGMLAPLARLHVHRVVPLIGSWLSRDSAYAYLQDSIAAFPAPERFAELMRSAGLDVVCVESFAFGAAQLYVGEVAAS